MKDRKKPEKFWLPHGMPSDDREFAFSSRVFPKASQIKALYKLWHYQLRIWAYPSTRTGHVLASMTSMCRSRALLTGDSGVASTNCRFRRTICHTGAVCNYGI